MKYLITLLSGLLFIFAARAVTITSTTSGGDWNNGSTWTGGNAPGANDNVFINGPVTVTANTTCNTLQVNSGKQLTINSNRTLTVNLNNVQNWSYNYVIMNQGTIVLAAGGGNKLEVLFSQNQSWPVFSNQGTFTGNSGTLAISLGNNTNAIANSGTFSAPALVTITNTSSTNCSVSGSFTVNNITLNKATQFKMSGVTVNGTMKLENGAYFTEHPVYGSDAILEIAQSYSTNGNYHLWASGTGNTVPPNIYISSGTVTMEEVDLHIKKNLLVAAGATFNGGRVCMYLTSSFESIMNMGTARLGGITIRNGATWNINADYTISTMKIESGGTVNAGSYSLTINNSLRNNCNINSGNIMEKASGGTFNAGTSTVTFVPAYWSNVEANNVVGGIVFNNVTVSGSQTLNIPNGTSMTVQGNLTLNSGATINTPQNINFGSEATLNNNGSTQNGNFPSSVGSAASGNSGGGSINASKWIVTNPNTYRATGNITFTGSPKVVVVQEGASLVAAGYTITCDSVIIRGSFSTTNAGGLSGTFGSAVVVLGEHSNISYNGTSGSQDISARTDYVNLTLSGESAKNFGSGVYEVSGNYTVTGAYPTYHASNTMRFDGTTQDISCPTFNNVQFTNSGTKSLSSTTSVFNTLTLAGSAVLETNSNLVLVSNASGTARVAAIPPTAGITGNVTVQRYVPALVRRSRMISPNVSNFTYNELKDDIFVTGNGGATNGFDSSNVNQVTVYTYAEQTGSRGWAAVGNINNALAPGQGALVFIRGDRTLPSPQWFTAPFVPQNEVTLDFYGPINTGNINPAITYSGTGSTEDDGWNLVGNPYPSQIDWTLVNKTNLYPFYYTLDASTGSYVAHDETSPYIASGQAFFIQASGPAPAIGFTENCKSASTPVSYFKTAASPFTVKMIKDQLNSDLAVLSFKTGASRGYDPNEDAVKMTNSVINLAFTTSNNVQLQYSKVPEVLTIDTFRLYASAASGTYTLDFTNLSSIPSNRNIYLRDRFTSTMTDLRNTTTYTFSITSNAATKGNRFEIIVADPSSLPVKWLSLSATPAQTDVIVSWSTASEKNNAGFTIERAAEKGDWQVAGFADAAKNATTVNNYRFTDAGALAISNTLFYRIRQTDRNGDISYSAIVAVSGGRTKEAAANLYPNPAVHSVTIEYGALVENGTVEVYDMFGKLMMSRAVSGALGTLAVSGLPEGVYTVKVSDRQHVVSTLKFVKE